MSVVVSIHLHPHGDETRARLLQTLRLNLVELSSDKATGKYDALLSHASSFKGDGTLQSGLWRTGAVARHARRLSPAHLVLAGLRACLGFTAQDEAELAREAWVPCERVLPSKPGLYLAAWREPRVVREVHYCQVGGENYWSWVPGGGGEVQKVTQAPDFWRELPAHPLAGE